MKKIYTLSGQEIKVCNCHYKIVKDKEWYSHKQGRRKDKCAAIRWGSYNDSGSMSLMHREVLNAPKGMVVDHINGDPSDNRCCNLRICTQSQNNANQKRAKHNSKSGHKGVYWHKAAQKWCAEVVCDYKKYYLGVFENKLDAVEAYNAKAKELYGDFFSKS